MERAVDLHSERFPVDCIGRDRRGQGERELFRVRVHGLFSERGERMGAPLALEVSPQPRWFA
jgi:hypothetical protein